MKKKFLAVGLVLAMGVLGLVGCGNNSGSYSDYVTLGEYIGLKVDKPQRQVSDAELREIREDELSYYTDYEQYDGPACQGDLVELSMTVKSGADMIYDFSAEDDTYELVLGEEEFGAKFDYNIIGQMKGTKTSFSVQYDDSELDENLANRSVDFDVEILNISKTVIPEITEEFIQENTDFASVAEWEANIAAMAQENVDYENDAAFKENIGKALVESCTISGYPEDLYKTLLESYEAEYENYAEMFNTTVEDIYAAFEVTHEDIEKMAKDACYQQMALELVAAREGIVISDADFDAMIEDFAKSEGYETRDEVLSDYTEEALKNIFLQDKTLDFLADKAIITVITE